MARHHSSLPDNSPEDALSSPSSAQSLNSPASGDDARMLHDSVADFIARGTDIKRVRRLRGTQPGFERTVWQQMAELGWLGILVPEKYGGLGLGCTEMAIV